MQVQCLQRPEGGDGSPGALVTGNRKAPGMCARNGTQGLCQGIIHSQPMRSESEKQATLGQSAKAETPLPYSPPPSLIPVKVMK